MLTENMIVTNDNVLGDGKGKAALIDFMGNDSSVLRSARVSYARENADATGGDEKLIRYLCKNRHNTPFEAVTLTFGVTVPIFVARQWHRHRTWSYNEVSARYTELDMGYYIPRPEVIGEQSQSSKQSRTIGVNDDLEFGKHIAFFIEGQCFQAFEQYRAMLFSGCPRELARSVLPMSTYTRFFGTVNLLNLWKFLELRLHPHAQWEIQQYAKALYQLAGQVAPVSFHAFYDYWLTDAHRGVLNP